MRQDILILISAQGMSWMWIVFLIEHSPVTIGSEPCLLTSSTRVPGMATRMRPVFHHYSYLLLEPQSHQQSHKPVLCSRDHSSTPAEYPLANWLITPSISLVAVLSSRASRNSAIVPLSPNFEQPYVFNRNHGLRGKSFQQCHLLISKGLHLRAADRQSHR